MRSLSILPPVGEVGLLGRRLGSRPATMFPTGPRQCARGGRWAIIPLPVHFKPFLSQLLSPWSSSLLEQSFQNALQQRELDFVSEGEFFFCCKKLLDLPAVTRSPQAVKTLLMLANSEKVAPRHRDRMCSLLCTGRGGQIALRLKLSVAVVVVLPRVCHATPASDNLASDVSTVQPPLPPSHHLQATSSVLLIWQQPLH